MVGQCTLNKFVDDAQQGGVADTPTGYVTGRGTLTGWRNGQKGTSESSRKVNAFLEKVLTRRATAQAPPQAGG